METLVLFKRLRRRFSYRTLSIVFRLSITAVPFPCHSQSTPGSLRLDVIVVICNGYSPNMPRGLAAETGGCWPPVDSGAKGIVCDFHRRLAQQSEQRGSVTRLSARL